MPFVIELSTPANTIINIQHFRITYDIYTPKHTFYDHSVKYYVQMRMKITKIVATRCQILRQNAPNSISAGAPPQTSLGELAALLRPPSWI